MPYLFQASIGPVQSFIKGARRTRDLKFNSSFLSRLARSAASILRDTCGKDSLIFPSLAGRELNELDDVPNKLLAYVEKDIPPEQLAQLVWEKIDEEVKKIKNGVFQKIDEEAKKIGNSTFQQAGQERFDRKMAEQQIADLIEYVWAAVPHNERDPRDNYGQRREELEAVLAARKNTRDFAPVSWEPEPSHKDPPKSSLDGALESVIHETEYPSPPSSATARLSDEERKRRKDEYDRKAVALRKIFDAGPHEKLSGVDLLKRLGAIPERSSSDADTPAEAVAGAHDKEEKPEAFPSTSHMAALPFLQGLRKLPDEARGHAEQQIRAYREKLQAIRSALPSFELDKLPKAYQHKTFGDRIVTLGEYDGALLYPERFPNVVGDTQVFQDQEARNRFQEAIRLLDDFLQKIGIRPTPYYALLVADGDFMGKAIDALAKKSDGIQQHKALSKELATFSQQVKETIEKHMGVRIYSGGDDVLVLLPLHEAVECAHELSTKFREALAAFSYDDAGKSPTLSAGLAIVHHLHPLGDALEIARQAEKRAKKGQKNALAITVQKRGGPPCKVGGPWGQFTPRLKQQIKLYLSGIIPSGMAYELEEIALRLETGEERKAELSPPHVQYAALRVFQRKLAEASRQGQKRKEALLALYALKRMVGLIDSEPNNERETPEQALAALQKKLNMKDGETERLKSLREQTSKFNQLQPVRVGQLADELIVARLFADAHLLAQGGTNEEGEQL